MYKNIIFLILLFQIQLLSVQNIKQIYIVSEEWKNLTNKDGTGLYFDIAKMIYEPLGIKVKTNNFPYSRATIMVEKKIADAWLGSYRDEEDYAIYPKYHFDKDIVFAMFKKDKIKDFTGVESLKDKKVSWIRGYGYEDYIDVPMNMQERNNRKSKHERSEIF